MTTTPDEPLGQPLSDDDMQTAGSSADQSSTGSGTQAVGDGTDGTDGTDADGTDGTDSDGTDGTDADGTDGTDGGTRDADGTDA